MGPHSAHRSDPPLRGHTAGIAQQVPGTSGAHESMGGPSGFEGGRSRAQNVVDGHPFLGSGGPGPGPGGGGSLPPHGTAFDRHSPFVIAVTPAARRRQSFQYVMPSQPQTGAASSSQNTGSGSHAPATSSQTDRLQKACCWHSELSTQRFPSSGGPPRGLGGTRARTISSSEQAAQRAMTVSDPATATTIRA